jgi:septal ring factor EnvC (AmiA/AmiB activator)
MPDTGLGQWFTLTELANRTDRKLDAVRAWGQRRRRERRHNWRKNNGGEWTVEATPEVLSELASGAALGVTHGDSGDAEELHEAREEIARLHEALTETHIGHARLEERLAAADRLLTDRAEALDDLRRDRDQERARGDRLEAALAEARRPWLAKVLEGLRWKG